MARDPKRAVIASNKYNKLHTRSVTLRFNLKTDADILEQLDKVGNKCGYVKNLIREDMKKNRA